MHNHMRLFFSFVSSSLFAFIFFLLCFFGTLIHFRRVALTLLRESSASSSQATATSTMEKKHIILAFFRRFEKFGKKEKPFFMNFDTHSTFLFFSLPQ